MTLDQLHSRLRAEVKDLRDDRDGPAHLIDHSLTTKELSEVRAALTEELRHHAIGGDRMDARYMPLLVLATEVGYRFGSNAYEYWPSLQRELEIDFPTDQQACEDLWRRFQQAKNVTGVVAPATDWSANNRRISWPITHAVLPIWLHELFLELLLSCPYRVEPGGSYVDWLLEQARGRYRHLEVLLNPARRSVARDVVEGILEVSPPTTLTNACVDRLRRDVYATASTRAKVRQAKARQPSLRPAPVEGSEARASRRALPETLVPLVLYTEPVSLALAPILGGPSVPEFADRVRVFPLGERRPSSLAGLIRDGAALSPPLPLEEQPVSLFDAARLHDVPGQLKLSLASMKVNVREPLLFNQRRGPAGAALQVLTGTFSPTPGWVVLTSTTPRPSEALASLGRWGALNVVQVDASVAAGAAWLTELGLVELRSPGLRLIGVAALDGPAGRTYSPTDPVFVEIEQGPVRIDDEEVGDGLYELRGQGPYAVRNPSGGGPVSLAVARQSMPPRPPDVDIELVGPEPSADALRECRLGLRIVGRAALSGLRASISVERDGRVIARSFTERLPPLPCSVAPDDRVWRQLVAEVPLARHVTLVVDVDGLAIRRWWLEPAISVVTWSDQKAFAEEKLTGFVCYSAEDPLTATDHPTEVHLREALVEGRGSPPGAALCVAPRRSMLALPEPRPPERFARDWAARGGPEPVVRGLLRWATARTEHLLAETARRQVVRHLDHWTARALCGEAWAKLESERRAPREFGDVAAAALRAADVARYEPSEVGWGPQREGRFLAALGHALRGSEPWLREIVDGDRDAGDLVPVIETAYAAAGAATAPDLACEPESTIAAIESALKERDAQRRIDPLLRRLLPQSRRELLAAVIYEEASDDALVEAVTEWLRSGSVVAAWPKEQVDALLGLWLWPARCAPPSERSFERAMADQFGARAVRYAALRRREAE
jgi:hypothetical protein